MRITSVDGENDEDIAYENEVDDEDDDEEEDEDEVPVTLGFVEKPKHDWSLCRHLFPSKAGGTPAWLDPVNLPTGNSCLCDICGEPLRFLLQAYAPLSDKDSTFHRTLFVFMCTSMSCLLRDQHEQWKHHPEKGSRSIKAFRGQLPRNNQFYSSEAPKNDGSDKPLGTAASLCSRCGTWKGDKVCSNCKRARYCSKKHQAIHWSSAHKIQCRTIDALQESSSRSTHSSEDISKAGSNVTWPEYEIINEDESEFDTEIPNSNAYGKALPTANEDEGDAKCWASFQKRIARAPEQVLRYSRHELANPLWPMLSGQPSKADIPKCTSCGSPRAFEFQILPQLLYYFDVKNEYNSLDWATIVVYTCEASCDGSLAYQEEFAWVQLTSQLEIRNNSQNGFNVPDASLVQVTSMYDVINLMNLGHRNRAVGATALNDRSSRSHSCLTVHVQGRDLTSGAVLRGCMHLVDLAGSERVDKSEATGDRLKEAQHINKSPSALGDVISSLAQKNSHVPYRNSKLTQLLQDSLGGQAKTLMFVHISPELNAVGETLSTLKFAERVATVELGAAQVHKDSSDVKDLKEQISNLKAALAKKEGDQDGMQQKVSGSPGGKLSSHSPRNLLRVDSIPEPKSRKKPKADVGNPEMSKKNRLRQKTQSYDLDELLANSPQRPPVSSPGQTYLENDREMGSGDWVDKVMVNKQDAARCWEAENAAFYQNYVPNSSKLYSEQSYTISEGGNGFDVVTNYSVDELDAATSDSSEPDLLWQFNHSKLPTMSRLNTSNAKLTKSPDLRSMTPRLAPLPSPSRKTTNNSSHPQLPQRVGRQVTTAEMKKKTGNRK